MAASTDPQLQGPAESTAAPAQPADSVAQDGTVAASGVAVLDKLAQLELQRKAEREKRREEAKEKQDPRENVKAFLQAFSTTQSAAEARLTEVQQRHQQSGPLDAAEVNSVLDELAAQMLAQEKSLAEASYYLPTYDQKQCVGAVQDLRARMETARADLLPKRKFAFSKKVARVKGTEVAASAAAAAPGDAASSANSSAHGGAISSGGGAQEVQGAQAAAGAGSIQGQGQAAAGASSAGGTQASQPSQQAGWLSSASERDISLVQAGRGLRGLRNQVVLRTAEQLASQDFVLLDLEGCDVFLLGHMPALRMLGLRNCRVVTGPVTGATFIDEAQGCTFTLASYQVRIHRAHATDFYLRVRSRPIIEHSTGLRFAPYALQHAGVQAQLARHKLHEESEMYRNVDDFGWIKAVQSPNWSVLAEGQRAPPPQVPPVTAAGGLGDDEI